MSLVVERRDDQYEYLHAEATVQRTSTPTVKKPLKPPPVVNVGDCVNTKYGKGWAISEVTAVTPTTFSYIGHTNTGRVTGTTRLADYGRFWRDYKPGRTYKLGAAFDAIKDLSDWGANYADASQVLSWRAHGKFNVPPGKNWHHIHEHSGGGANSVTNLGLIDFKVNQVDFRVWFGRAQTGTGGMPLRQWLAQTGADPQEHLRWGLRCLAAHGYRVVPRDQGRGPYQEII